MFRNLSIRLGVAFAAAAFGSAALAQGTLGSADPATVGFKRAVAQRIIQIDKPKAAQGGLKGISVVGYTLDRKGNITEQWIVRSSGDDKLDARAIAILRKAAPLPAPPATIFGAEQYTHLSEAWLFTSDGHYKLQSLVSN